MDKMLLFYSSSALLILLQIHYSLAAECVIVSVESPSASQLDVKWQSYSGAAFYNLTLKDMNLTGTTPVMQLQVLGTQRLVNGLRHGHFYELTLSAFDVNLGLLCKVTKIAMTVPAVSEFTSARAISSTSIEFTWTNVIGADSYILFVEKTFGSTPIVYNRTFTSPRGQMDGLTSSTLYTCYIFSSNNAGRGAKSNSRTIETLVQPPTGVTVSSTGKSTALVKWNIVSNVLRYQVTVTDTGKPDKPHISRTTSSISMEISQLEPCSIYIVEVSSLNYYLVAGEPSVVTYNTTTIGGVTTVSVKYDCSTSRVTVTWDVVYGAHMYRAVAVDGTGDSFNCTSNSTSCPISELKCGENYQVHVTAISNDCESTPTIMSTFETVPCAPVDLKTTHDCFSNVLKFSWEPTNNTLYYVAKAVDNKGLMTPCMTPDRKCYFTNVECGRSYTYSVYAVSSECNSQISQPKTIYSSPCLPTNVVTQTNCLTNTLHTTWDSSEGALSYTVEAKGNNGKTYNCSSPNNTCEITGVPCGEQLSVWIMASNDNCSTDKLLVESAQTVPCTPVNVFASANCKADSARVSWTPSSGTIFYIALAEDANGNSRHCYSLANTCSIEGLACGQNYTVKVISTNFACNSTASHEVHFMTATCPPTNIEAFRDCDANHAVITWQHIQTSGIYTAWLEDQDGPQVNCTSDSVNNCTIMSLPCGKTYNVTVSYSNGQCQSTSTSITMDSVPCAPENITTDWLCDTNDLTVSWESSSLPLSYSVMAVPLNGSSPIICNTNNSSCVLRGFQCGQTLNISVNASSDICSGLYSPIQTVQTGPCASQKLTVETDCVTNSLVASWEASPGASSYTATVIGPNGFSENCSTSNLTCYFLDLQCASNYTVQVRSQGSLCISAPIQTVATTGPCDPVNVTSTLQCGSDTATVSWSGGARASAHTVLAQEGGSHRYVSCKSSTTSCQLKQLQCGKVYNFTVLAEDATCNSTGGATGTLVTAPCSPSIQSSTLTCGNNSALLTWTPVAGATDFIVNATAVNGHSVSCSSDRASCSLTDLMCGQIYSASVTARGNKCDSLPGPITNLTTVPCPPVVTSKQYDCSTSTATIGWSDTVGRFSFFVQVAGDGHEDSCQTTNTSCMFRNLPCGFDFNVSVQAMGAECNSSISTSASLKTVPCAPENMNAVTKCSSDSAIITWVSSPSAVGHNVTVTGQDGHTHLCHTNSTSCHVTDLHCGETYSVTATPYSQTCRGASSSLASFKAGLCAPSNVSVSPACENSTISWTPVTGAEMYIATATADDGHNHTCSSNDSSSCNFTDLHCGETYDVRVVTLDQSCWSEPSQAVQLKAAPCPPANLSGHLTCETNTLTLTWHPVIGATYVLQWERIGGTSPPSEYITSNISHSFSNLVCGERYAFRVAAEETDCRIIYSPPIEISTAPCQPTNLTVRVDCGTKNGNFSWAESKGGSFYVVEVTGEHGHVASCSSNDTSCAVKLDCGHSYSATLVASTENCNSTRHTDIYFDSAPCLPDNVIAELDCKTNMMNVNWTQTSGSDVYTAWAIATDGHRASCNSTSNHCSIQDLRCGRIYEVAVTSSSIDCEIIAGSDYKVQAAPCKAENTSAELNCTSNMMTVRWHDGNTVQNYSVRATSASGVNSTCETTENSCSFLELSCGQLYTFTVTGYNNVCVSDMGDPIERHTAPCPPTSVSADLNCTTHTALISWSRAAAATAYSAVATSSAGHNSSCIDMGASCELEHLVCGQQYSVIVEAIHASCPGPASAPVNFSTEPCDPTSVSVDYDASGAWVMWSPAEGATSYYIQAESNSSLVNCTTNTTRCFLQDLLCSHVYNITVIAGHQACSNVVSDTLQLVTGPCPPTNVQTSISCDQLTATVSWLRSYLAVGYVAYFSDQSGQNASCTGTRTDTSCVVSGLTCGSIYRVWVIALGEQHNSSDSSVVSLTSAPCQPHSIESLLDCQAHSATVSWQPTVGAESYAAVLTSSSGHSVSCSTNATSCQLSSLHCGLEYNVTLKALGETCNSTATMEGHLITETCPPVNLSVHYNGTAAQVMWAATGSSLSSVSAVTEQGLIVDCNSTTAQCSLTDLQCSQTYNITVKTRNSACNNTVTSAPHRLITAPCPPTNIQVVISCEQLIANVSWQQSDFAVGYVAYLDNQNGHSTSCMKTTPDNCMMGQCEEGDSCIVQGLICGSIYRVWVKALGEQYNSSDSSMVHLTSAPCLPANITAKVSCESDSDAIVSWSFPPILSPISTQTNISVMTIVGGSPQTLCTTQHSYCNLTGLSCGETHNLSLTATNEQCSLTAQTHINVTTRPCRPPPVYVSLLCGTNTAAISWDVKPEVELYTATAIKSSGGELKTCNSSSFSCQITGLDCGEMYNFTVAAYSDGCWSPCSSPIVVQTGPCIPREVAISAQCEFNMGSVSWGPSDGAESYVATATGVDGHTHLCLTNTTSCTWTDLHCGESYSVEVRAQADNCTSSPSNSSVIYMNSCRPDNVTAAVNCDQKAVSLDWDISDRTGIFMVSAEGGGRVISLSTNSTSARFSDLICGQNYSLTVTPYNQHCTDNTSVSTSVLTWPCMPVGISTSQDCISGIVEITWDSSNASDYYTANMQTDTGISEKCMSESNSCSVMALTCGHNYSVSVTASNQQCNITSEETTSLQSVPCIPTNVSVKMDCSNNTAAVSWSPSRGDLKYSVMVNSSSSDNSCIASDLSCITCGANYTIQVVAMDDQCSSHPSPPVLFQSGPCPPHNLNTELSCLSNDLTVTWDAVRDADHFLVSLTSASGGSSEICNTTNTACSTGSLTCGNTYTVQVISVRGNCKSELNLKHSVQSAPCQPEGIRGHLDCVTNSAWISWNASPGAESYTVLAVGGDSHTANCTASTNTTCEVENLACGVSYNFTVTAKNSQCEGPPSASITLQTAPCSLSAITVFTQCHNSSILVEWGLMGGGTGNTVYTATAKASDQTYLHCNSTGSSCYLREAQCGLHYTIIVTASSDQCSSLRSPTYRISMEPCAPRDVAVDVSCQNHSALVSWTPSPIAESYQVIAVAADGHGHTCNTTSSDCLLSELHCEQQYTVFVKASHENCTSKASQNVAVNTGPCQLSVLSTTFHCANRSVMLTWTPSDNNPADYYGYAEAENGDRLHCHSAEPGCTINGLVCGTVYNFSVQVSDGTCNSSFSDPVQIAGVPCPPQDVKVRLMPIEMEIEMLHFSWTEISCADAEYMLTLTGSLLGDSQALFELSSYWTSVTYFEFPLPCSSSYVATLQSRNDAGMSGISVPLNGTTAPCPPSGVKYSSNASFITVAWNSSVFATTYTVYDASVSPNMQLCTTVELSCSLPIMSPSSLVVTASNDAGESQPENVVKVFERRRRGLMEQVAANGNTSTLLLEVTQTSPAIISLRWSPVEDASFYNLLIMKPGSSKGNQQITVFGESITLSDLSPNSAYCFSVLAVTAEKSGPESEPVCLQS